MEFQELNKLNLNFNEKDPFTIIEWICNAAYAKEKIAMTTAFQISGVVIMHMLKKLGISIPIFFIDTGFHFPQTIDFQERITKLFQLNVTVIKPKALKCDLESKNGKYIYESNPDFCCQMNKIEPLNQLKSRKNIQFWMSGLRRDQGGERSNYNVFMIDKMKKIRIHPLLNWNWNQVWKYTIENKIPYHPLYDEGYSSIGCFPPSCTSKNEVEQGERSGRWNGNSKSECGLHSDLQ